LTGEDSRKVYGGRWRSCSSVVADVGGRRRNCKTSPLLLPQKSWAKRSVKKLKNVNQRCQSSFIQVKRTKNHLLRWWKICRCRWVTVEEGEREGIGTRKGFRVF